MNRQHRPFTEGSGKNSLKRFYLELYKKRIKKGHACEGIKKRLKMLGVRIF